MTKKKRINPKQRALVAAASIVAALLLTMLGLYSYGKASEETIVPGVSVGDVAIGGQTVPDAMATIQAAADQLATLTVAVDGKEHQVKLANFGVTINAEKTAKQAFALGIRSRPLVAGWVRATYALSPTKITAQLDIDQAKLEEASGDLADKVGIGLADARLQYKKGTWSVIASKSGRGVQAPTISNALQDRAASLDATPIDLQSIELEAKVSTADARGLIPDAQALTAQPMKLTAADQNYTISSAQLASWVQIDPGPSRDAAPTLKLNEAKVTDYVQSIAKDFDQDPQDAQVSFADGQVQVAQMNKDGRALDQKAAVQAIIGAFNQGAPRTLTLTVITKKSEVTSDSLAQLGIKQLIGQATTSYIGSPANRVHNIANGVKFLTGKLVKPGDEFSVVKTLGTIDDTTGYLPELVIKDNATEPEFGGGLCQVSTTLFRAVMNAGLKVTARTNHSYRVPYYERGVGPGLDATIYDPQPDFKFLNDTPGWILIQAYMTPKKDEVTFELYGTSDGRKGDVGKPVVYDVQGPPPPIYIKSDTLPVGKTKQVDHAHPGAKATVKYTVYKADGSVMFTQTFNSVYKPWAAKYLVGTAGATPSPSASPSPTPSATTTSPTASPTSSPSPTATPTSTAASTTTPSPTTSPTATSSASPTPSATDTTTSPAA